MKAEIRTKPRLTAGREAEPGTLACTRDNQRRHMWSQMADQMQEENTQIQSLGIPQDPPNRSSQSKISQDFKQEKPPYAAYENHQNQKIEPQGFQMLELSGNYNNN